MQTIVDIDLLMGELIHIRSIDISVSTHATLAPIFRQTHTLSQVLYVVFYTFDLKPRCLFLLQTQRVQTERFITPDVGVINLFFIFFFSVPQSESVVSGTAATRPRPRFRT